MAYKKRELTLPQMREIYENAMIQDFPENELKPFSSIERMYQEDRYRGYVLEENGRIQAYWMLLQDREKKTYLLDYLAVLEGKRGNGYGSKALSCILQNIGEDEIVVIEAENPQKAENQQQRELQERRLEFYRKNGVVFTGVTSVVFQAPYVIMLLSRKQTELGQDEVKQCYLDFYEKFILDKEKTQKNVAICFERKKSRNEENYE